MKLWNYFLGGLLLLPFAAVAQSSGKVGYAPKPNDTYWHVPENNFQQWHLENRAINGARTGIDSNAREAWATTKGDGIVIAIADDGVDLEHPDLTGQDLPFLHYNFEYDTIEGHHANEWMAHGTPVTGTALAKLNNALGVAGLAPQAKFASWVIYQTNGLFVSRDQLAKMFQTHLGLVQVQNHSWFVPGAGLTSLTPAEDAAIAKAVTEGRDGKGVIIVRAAGNGRLDGKNANDDAYANDPRQITVAALNSSGGFALYSNPGACLLVAAPGGDSSRSIFTTDRQGSAFGYNRINFENDLADYIYHNIGFQGTSASSPLVAATVALVLSVNPDLHYRDVQQLLIHSANPTQPADPDALPNGAGYIVSHHSAFGNVDAGRAVEHAKRWKSRPAKTIIRHGITGSKPMVDGGLTVQVTGPNVPEALQRIKSSPSLGVFPETSTGLLPLVDVGLAAEDITQDLRGKGAITKRGPGTSFATKLIRAAAAGAEFGILYNDRGGDAMVILGATELVPIPAVSITQNDGEALVAYIAANPSALVQISHERINYTITVPETLLCEHVGLRVRTTHQRRGDVRIVLVSPSGTKSVMQRLNADEDPGPANLTYYSTHHFYESSKGEWQVYISDQVFNAKTGSGEEAELIIHGVPIQDADADGLEDAWEQQYFASLDEGPLHDSDQDGVLNAREQILGTPPNLNTIELIVSVAPWNPGYLCMSWPSTANTPYHVTASLNVTKPGASIGTVPGEHQRSSAVVPSTEASAAFLQVTKP